MSPVFLLFNSAKHKIIRGRRSMNTPLSLHIKQALGLEEGLLMTLQVYYDIAEEKRRISKGNRPFN